jgi:hypothetical protein
MSSFLTKRRKILHNLCRLTEGIPRADGSGTADAIESGLKGPGAPGSGQGVEKMHVGSWFGTLGDGLFGLRHRNIRRRRRPNNPRFDAVEPLEERALLAAVLAHRHVSKNAEIRANTPTTNYGSAGWARSSSPDQASLFSWDLNAIPTGSTVQSAA